VVVSDEEVTGAPSGATNPARVRAGFFLAVALGAALCLGGCVSLPQSEALYAAAPAGLPERAELANVPRHRQDDFLCGPAALASVFNAAGVPATVEYRVQGRVSPAIETAAYFVVSEALQNAVRHAPGAAVQVTLAYAPGALTVRVRDDGPGGAAPEGHGLRGMRERVAMVGGSLSLRSEDGFVVEAVLPT